jgi:hypothetical protein
VGILALQEDQTPGGVHQVLHATAVIQISANPASVNARRGTAGNAEKGCSGVSFGSHPHRRSEGQMALAAGAQFEHYEVESVIGVGGMGEMYRARDTKLQRPVGLKVRWRRRRFERCSGD